MLREAGQGGREYGEGSRERLLTALRCGVPDRVPINTYELPGWNTKDWYNMQPSYAGLMEKIRRETDCISNWEAAVVGGKRGGEGKGGWVRMFGSGHRVACDREIERRGGRVRTTEVAHTPGGDLRRVLEVDESVLTVWQVEHWCKGVEDAEKVMSVPFEPLEYDGSDLARVEGELGGRGLVMTTLDTGSLMAADLMSFSDFTEWAFVEEEHFAKVAEEGRRRNRENLGRMLGTCVVDLYRIVGPEYFTPPYLPPRMFERFVAGEAQEMTEMVHEAGGLVRLHCHGKIGQVLDMICGTGCDGIDPCEPKPDGDIDLEEVKRRCMARGVSVWGNIELKVLENGTEGEVREVVRRCMAEAKEGGGYVVLPTAAPINVPLSERTERNYGVMIDTARELGGY